MAETNDVAAPAAASPARTPAPSAPAERVELVDYLEDVVMGGKTAGLVVAQAKPGYIVTPTDKALPLVNEVGIPMTEAQWEALRDEAGEYLRPKAEKLEG